MKPITRSRSVPHTQCSEAMPPSGPYRKIRRHPQNRNVRNVLQRHHRRISDGHRQHAQKIRWSSVMWFGLADRHTHHNPLDPFWGGVGWFVFNGAFNTQNCGLYRTFKVVPGVEWISKNRKYIEYRNATRAGLSYGHRQHAQSLTTFGHGVFELCQRTDRQTDILIALLGIAAGDEVTLTTYFCRFRPASWWSHSGTGCTSARSWKRCTWGSIAGRRRSRPRWAHTGSCTTCRSLSARRRPSPDTSDSWTGTLNTPPQVATGTNLNL